MDQAGNPILYLTDNWAYSLFYIRDREIDFVTCGVREGGIVHFDERFPRQLETLYNGMSGWIYEVEADAKPTKIKGIYVLRDGAKVTGKWYIPDALGAIREEIEKGTVHFLAYEDLTQAQKQQNREGMTRWFLTNGDKNTKKTEFFRQHFPEAWEVAQNILAQSEQLW